MKLKPITRYLLLAFGVGLAVFAISAFAAWRSSRELLMNNHILAGWTSSVIREINVLIGNRIEQGGTPPHSLQELVPELKPLGNSLFSIKPIKNGVPVDGWGRPLLYKVHGTSYTLVSYGRDGKPGGFGLDRDSNAPHDYKNPVAPMPTLHQFFFELPSHGMIRTCALSGLIAFVACLCMTKPQSITRQNVRALAINIVCTVVGTIIFAFFIMQLHVPSGH